MTEIKRRSILQSFSALAVGSAALMKTGSLQAARDEVNQSVDGWPDMQYQTLGKTGFEGSRLVFGCGAALSAGQANDLLEPALESGINVFDVGYRNYYKDAEENLAPFLKKHDDKIFTISKANPEVDLEWDEEVDTATARQAASNWSTFLDQSLSELGVEHLDAYYVMAGNNVSLIKNDEMYEAFLTAKQAGKVDHWGVSTHQNAEKLLLAMAETGRYALAQIAITPAGWYDWIDKGILDDGKAMTDLRDVLDTARAAGIGLIGMKAGRYLAGRRFLGWGNPDAFDEYYEKDLLQARLTSFQRSYAYVLAHGLDAVNADMQSWQHLRENHYATTEVTRQFFI